MASGPLGLERERGEEKQRTIGNIQEFEFFYFLNIASCSEMYVRPDHTDSGDTL